jgi:branched-chain amino acid transport system permease protein
MIDELLAYRSLFDQIIINSILAYSQYIVLRAGVFSLATAGFASIGAYAAAISVMSMGLPAPVGVALGIIFATLVALLIGWPLARLRGVFQAIATLAFVQIVLSLAQNAAWLTRGALGINGIPKTVTTPVLIIVLVAVIYVLWSLGRSRLGRAFDAIRQDETVAVALGVAVFRTHLFAFAASGFLGGLGGALEAYHSYSVTPEEFGFHLLIACLTFVVLGGRVGVAGPLVGAVILTLLPEVARPFKDYRMFAEGALLILVIIYLPNGIVDTLRERRLGRHLARSRRASATPSEGATHGAS